MKKVQHSKLNSPLLMHMRSMAYAPIKERKAFNPVAENDRLSAADAKRQRRLERNRKLAGG